MGNRAVSGSLRTLPVLQQAPITRHVTIAASDASGVPVQGSLQHFTVTLTVLLPPCLLSTPSPATIAYSLAQGQSASTPSTVGLSESGTCALPVTWQASTSSSWLALTATSGVDSGTGSSFGVTASAVNEVPGKYTGNHHHHGYG